MNILKINKLLRWLIAVVALFLTGFMMKAMKLLYIYMKKDGLF